MIKEKKLWLVLVFLWITTMIFQSCRDSQLIDPELNLVYSIEAFQSPDLHRALVLANDNYPCVIPDRCPPDIIKTATLELTGPAIGRNSLLCDSLIYTSDTTLYIPPGEQVTLEVQVADQTFAATSIMPDSLNLILAFDYSAAGMNDGLYLKVDTNSLKEASGFYLQFLIQNDNPPQFGFLITESVRSSPQNCNQNGCFVGPDIYYIPENTLLSTGVQILPDDLYLLISRNITAESLAYYRAFNTILPIGNFNTNNGLFFAPPESLPTNFDNLGFGFFHLYYEQALIGEIP